jgi:Chalcone isomerase-like
MSHIKNIFRISWLCLGLVSGLHAQTSNPSTSSQAVRNYAAGAPAVKTAGGFPAQILVDNTRLNLNGQGTRYKAIFKVYDMAMYTSTKVTTPEQAISAPGPKRLQFVALRELSGTDLGLLFLRGMKENSPPELNTKHAASASRLVEVFSGKAKMLPGESFAMEFVPGRGLTFFIMDKPQGAPLGDAEFFGMVLRIWLGSAPADYMLKDALLGATKG